MEGETYAVDAFTWNDGTVVDKDDYHVFYFVDEDHDGELEDGEHVVTAKDSIDNVTAGMPAKEGDYIIALVDAEQFAAKGWVTSQVVDGWYWNEDWCGDFYKAAAFKVQAEKISVEGAYAYEGPVVNPTDEQLADRTFNYNGSELEIAFAVNGEEITNVGVEWAASCPEVPAWSDATQSWVATKAGNYTATLKGQGLWTDTETVDFTIEGIDLSEGTDDAIVLGPATQININSYGNVVKNQISINGVEMTPQAELTATIIAKDGVQSASGNYGNPVTDKGRYTVRIAAVEGSTNVTGVGNYYFDVVTDEVAYAYNGDAIATDGSTTFTFDAAKGTFFTTDAITAQVNGKDVAKDITVTKDGAPVTTYTEPGVYEVTLDTPVAADHSYAGHETFKFTVKGKDYTDSIVYATWQGKNLEDKDTVVYTGSAVDPTVVVKDAKGNTLTEGEDYTVAIESDGEAAEAVNVGKYQIVVTFNGEYPTGTWNGEEVLNFEIVKAEIVSAEATEVYYALPEDGSAAAPAFVGYTEPALKGQAFDLAADDIAVTYYDKDGEKVDAADLTAAGNYTADITVKNTAQNLKGSVKGVKVVVADAVAFSDVDSNAWYAPYVFEAKNLHYMNGVDGTTLFLPENAITRAEIAQVVYNMAGTSADAALPPVDFDDIEAGAWYVRAVSFVNTAGVMTGYDSNDSFGVYDNATREQLATTMYRYAQVTGQDVTVEDEDAALAKYADGGQVADWAKTAMAWAVENGVMGVDVDSLRPQDSIIRAEVAAIAIRVQPQQLEKPVI